MDSQILTPRKMNPLKRLITEAGLDRNQFSFNPLNFRCSSAIGYVSEHECTALYHAEGYFFEFNSDGRLYYPKFKPGFKATTEEYSNFSWKEVVVLFEKWLEILKRELDEPDPWAEAERYISKESLSELALSKDHYFTQEQIREIDGILDRLKDEIIDKIKPVEENIILIKRDIKSLKEKARKDDIRSWAQTLIGVMFTAASSCGVPVNFFSQIWNFVILVFKGVKLLSKIE